MTNPSDIGAVFFDLGMVLVTFDWEIAIPHWSARNGGDAVRLREFLAHPLHDAFERDALSADEFYEQGLTMTGFGGTRDEFTAHWNEIFTEIPENVAVARRLARHLPLYLLSNTNPWHAAYLETQFHWMQLFTARFYSCRLGVRKPDPRIYQLALARAGVAPRHAVFFDDRLDNVEGARRVGMRAYQVPTPDTLLGLVRELFPDLLPSPNHHESL